MTGTQNRASPLLLVRARGKEGLQSFRDQEPGHHPKVLLYPRIFALHREGATNTFTDNRGRKVKVPTAVNYPSSSTATTLLVTTANTPRFGDIAKRFVTGYFLAISFP